MKYLSCLLPILFITLFIGCQKSGVEGPGKALKDQRPLNVLESVTVIENKGTFRITIQSKSATTPTVFKIKKPLRLVLDFENSNLSSRIRDKTFSYATGLIQEIAFQEFQDETESISRVIVSLRKNVDFNYLVKQRLVQLVLPVKKKRAR
jgi:hypothetical protein